MNLSLHFARILKLIAIRCDTHHAGGGGMEYAVLRLENQIEVYH
jgi:hypothetical protein